MSRDLVKSDSLFITMHHLHTVSGVHKYHWTLYHASEAPKGFLLHATDFGRPANDLKLEIREVIDPVASKTMVVCLRIGATPGMEVLRACAESIPLMNTAFLPHKETRWTCRVWVEQLLLKLAEGRYIELPADLATMERLCLQAADMHISFMGKARVFNDLYWMSLQPLTLPLDTSTTQDFGPSRYYGPKPMKLDSTPYSGTDRYGSGTSTTIGSTALYSPGQGTYGGTEPMNIDTALSGGKKPMDIDWTGGGY